MEMKEEKMENSKEKYDISLYINKKIQIVNKRGMNNEIYLKYIDITIPDNQYQIINMNKLETATTNIKLNEILKILEFKNQEIKLNSYFEMIIDKDSYKKQAQEIIILI